MKKALSVTAFVLMVLVIVMILLNFYHSYRPDNKEDKQDVAYKAYLQQAEAQQGKYMKQAEVDAAKVREVTGMYEANQKRFTRLLARWEKQADRSEALLKKREKQDE